MLNLTYRELSSPVHRLGVSTKVALFGWLGVLSLLYSDVLFLACIAGICVALASRARVGSSLGSFLRTFLPFFGLVLAINILANQHGEHLIFRTIFRFYWWRIGFRVTSESVAAALRMVLRLLSIILIFLVFTLTTKPEALLERLSAVRGFEGFGLLLALSYRFLPTLLSDGLRIRDSLRSRGVKFNEGSRFDRLRSYSTIGIPLIVNSLDRSIQVAEALESRGYAGAGQKRRSRFRRSGPEIAMLLYYLCAGSIFMGLWLWLGIGRADIFASISNLPAAPALFASYLVPVSAWRDLV